MKLLRNIIDHLFLSGTEASRVLKLLPLLVGVSLLIYLAKSDNSSPLPVVIYAQSDSSTTLYSTRPTFGQEGAATSDHSAAAQNQSTAVQGQSSAAAAQEIVLFEFDPNTLSLEGFEQLGFSTRQAQVIINYRNAGAQFRRPEDFARCYTVSEEMFEKLIPYINIGEAAQNSVQSSAQNAALQSAAITQAAPAPSAQTTQAAPAQTAASSDTTPSTSAATTSATASTTGLFDSNGYALSSSYASTASARENVTFPLDLNSADSATLVLVRGIGALTAGRIVEYRGKLGGFSAVEQLAEVKGMNERNYLTILEQIFIDSCGIKKIDVNFATPKQISLHPYITDRALAKIIKNRQLRGGWRTIEEFEKDNILDEHELEQLRPYLFFDTQVAQ